MTQQLAERDRLLATAQARISGLEAENAALRSRLGQVVSLVADLSPATKPVKPLERPARHPGLRLAASTQIRPHPGNETKKVLADRDGTSALHPAARKLLTALAQHAPARFTWSQTATLAGPKPSGRPLQCRT